MSERNQGTSRNAVAPRRRARQVLTPTATFRPSAASRLRSTRPNRWRSPVPAAAARARSCTFWAVSIDPPRAMSISAGNALSKLDIDAFRAREVGFVFQSFYLMPTLTALENIQIPMFEGPYTAAERSGRAERLIEEVGLADRSSHRPAQLSVGQRQRVAIARSLANDPSLLLADEPTGNLDSKSQDEIIQLLHHLRDARKLTLVIVTHSHDVAQAADRRIPMKDGQIQLTAH